jgi:AmmeMemoRadiSam system protein B
MQYPFKIFLLFFIIFYSAQFFAKTYKAHLSDRWYPSSGRKLNQMLNDLQLQAAHYRPAAVDAKKIQAIIVPHAAYKYGGAVASSVYQRIKRGQFNHVIVLAPSHDEQFEGVALPSSMFSWYKNPFGYISLDQTLLSKLVKASSLFFCRHDVHELEHSVEVQIPFIQKYCGYVKITPLIVGHLSMHQIQEVAKILHSCMQPKTLIVISSDFVHYGKSFNFVPFDTDIIANIEKIDEKLAHFICHADVVGLQKFLHDSKVPVCGKNPLLILMNMMQKKYLGAVQCARMGQEFCGTEQEDLQDCVSYMGIIVAQK